MLSFKQNKKNKANSTLCRFWLTKRSITSTNKCSLKESYLTMLWKNVDLRKVLFSLNAILRLYQVRSAAIILQYGI